MNGQAGTHSSMFAAYFPGEKYTITFEPTPEQSDAITRMVTARSTSDAESETMLQMLGIIPSEGAFNPSARDAWTKRPPHHAPHYPTVEMAADGSINCKNDHLRATYSYINEKGKVRCRKCQADTTAAYRARVREKKAA